MFWMSIIAGLSLGPKRAIHQLGVHSQLDHLERDAAADRFSCSAT